MNKLNQIQLQTLDQHLTRIRMCERPVGGWIASIRKSLGMTVRQLGNRIGISQQSTSRLEANEVNDTITLKSLRKTAEALDCKLVYALIPNEGSLQATIEWQAFCKAKDIVESVNHSMMLEAQAVNNIEEKIKEIANELAQDPNSKLWD